MDMEFAAPPRIKLRRSYAALIAMVKSSPGEWVKVSIDEITGQTKIKKQAVVWSAANLRKIKVETTVQGDFMYVRQIIGA